MNKNTKFDIEQIDRMTKSSNFSVMEGILLGFCMAFIFIGLISEKIFLQNITQLKMILQSIGIGGIIIIVAFNIVKFSTIGKSDIGLFYLPIFLILLPTLGSILENKYSILISTVITVILSIILIYAIPKDLKPNLILNWKLLDNIFISLGAFLIFASFYFPEKITNLTIKEIVEKVKSGIFGSVFVYVVFRFFMALFEYKIEKSKLNGEDKSN